MAKTAAFASEGELNGKVMSDLNPGIQVKNALVYEVSKAAFDRNSWRVGVGAGNRLKVDIRADAYPDVPHENIKDCNALEAVADRKLCSNPNLFRCAEILTARLVRHQRSHPNDKTPALDAALERLWKCEDRACLAGAMVQAEALAKDWRLS